MKKITARAVFGTSAHRPERLLDLQGPPQSEAVSGLFVEDNLSLVAHGTLSQALEEFAHLVLAFDLGAETADGSRDRQIRVVDIHRDQFELQTGLARQRPNGPGERDLAGDARARGNRGLTVDDDIPIQRGRKALARLVDLRAELFAEANGQRGSRGNNNGLCRSGCSGCGGCGGCSGCIGTGLRWGSGAGAGFCPESVAGVVAAGGTTGWAAAAAFAEFADTPAGAAVAAGFCAVAWLLFAARRCDTRW